MGDFDWLSTIMPEIISAIIAFIILGLGRVTRATEDTVTHTVKMEGFSKDFESVDKRLEKIENGLEVNDKEIYQFDWRLKEIERKLDRLLGYRNGKGNPI